MNLLLDTCVFIWLTQAPDQISARAKRLIDDPANELYFSHASIWEIHLKHQAGKLNLPEPPRLWLSHQLAAWAVIECSIDLESLHVTSDLPRIHKDPFDRLIVAQSHVHKLALVSPDDHFRRYDIKVIW